MKWNKKVLFSGMLAVLLTGCGKAQAPSDAAQDPVTVEEIKEAQELIGTDLTYENLFTDRDISAAYDKYSVIKLNGNTASCEDTAVKTESGTITIQAAGTFLLQGSFTGKLVVDVSKKDKVQLVMDGAHISCDGTAPVYVKQADKVFLTLAQGSENRIFNTGEFAAIDDNKIDAAVFSKADLTINGTGALEISSQTGHGVVSKDDLAVTGGSIVITADRHGLSGKDSVRIGGGKLEITSGKDGIHSENEDDDQKGYVYIHDGDILISSEDDAIHGEILVVVEGGKLNIADSYEGIEGKVIDISGGTLYVRSRDDGLNASDGSGGDFGGPGMGGFGGRGDFTPGKEGGFDEAGSEGVYVKISGGSMEVWADGDGLDSNGALYITGGEIYVTGPTNSANGALDYTTTGQITGGILCAVGASGMAMNLDETSTQGSVLTNTENWQEAGAKVTVKDESGKELISYTARARFNSVVVSCLAISVGETYAVTAGEETKTITMSALIEGQTQGFGGFGGFGGGFGGGRGDRPQDMPKDIPEDLPKDMPDGMPEGGPRDKWPDRMPDGAGGPQDMPPKAPKNDTL